MGINEELMAFHEGILYFSLTITWTGRLVMPAKAFPNAVAPFGDAGLAVTLSFEMDNSDLIPAISTGRPTGYVLEWARKTGFYRVPGSAASLNNGLKIDPDGKQYYIADWGGEALLKVPTSIGKCRPCASLSVRSRTI